MADTYYFAMVLFFRERTENKTKKYYAIKCL